MTASADPAASPSPEDSIIPPAATPAEESAAFSSAAPARPGRVPDFFIAGHPKSGTTALYEILRAHPQIFMSDLKEPRFFTPELPSSFQPRDPHAVAATFDDYLALFGAAAPDQLVGEASTQYVWSRTAAGRIAEVQPAARVIVIMREPVAYLSSLHLQLLQNHSETEKSLRRALALEEGRREGRRVPPLMSRWPHVLLYSERVRYVEQLRRFHEAFPPDQTLVLIYDDFRDDNEATVRRVLGFLGVDDSLPLTESSANPSARMRSTQLERVLTTVSVGRGPLSGAVKRGLGLLIPRQLRGGARRALRRRLVFGQPRPPDAELVLELRRRFKGEVVSLSEYLDRDLVRLWGYDEVT